MYIGRVGLWRFILPWFVCWAFSVNAQIIPLPEEPPVRSQFNPPFMWNATPLDEGMIAARVERVTLRRGVVTDVNTILQDKLGFLWLGFSGGLLRYDGMETQLFQTQPGDPTSLLGKQVSVVYEDKEDRLWIASDSGLNLYSPGSNSFSRFPINEENAFSTPGLTALLEGQGVFEGWLLVGTNRGLDALNPETGEVERVLAAHADERWLKIRFLDYDERNNLWIATDKGLFVLEERDGDWKTKSIPFRFAGKKWGQLPIDGWCRDGQGRFLAAVNDGLYLFDPKKRRFEEPPFALLRVLGSWAETKVDHLYIDPRDGIWMSVATVGVVYYPNPDQFRVFYHDSTNENSLSYNQAKTIHMDRSGLAWIGTFNGLNKVHFTTNRIDHISIDPRLPGTLSSNFINCFLVDKRGELWIGTDKGINRIMPNGGIKVYRKIPGKGDSLMSDQVWAMTEDNFGQKWITTTNGLHRFKPETDSFEVFPNGAKRGLKSKYPQHLAVDANGKIWIGSEDKGVGLQVFNPISKTFKNGTFRPNGKTRSFSGNGESGSDRVNNGKGLSNNMVTALIPGGENDLWVGTAKGLNHYDLATKRVTLYDSDTSILKENYITDLHRDRQGNLWVLTETALYLYEADEQNFEPLSDLAGLPENTIFYAIDSDRDGNIWFSHGMGLSRLVPTELAVLHYDLNDGLNNQYYFGSAYRSPNGTMFFGGSNGFNLFRPDQFTMNKYIPPILFTDISYDGEEIVSDSPLTDLKKISLPHSSAATLKFQFAAMDFTHPSKNRYSFYLDNFHKDWAGPYSDNYASFSGLSPGKYTMRVIGTNNDGIWNETGKSVIVHLVPPWWIRTEALLFYIIAVPLLIYGLYRLRVRRLRTRANELAELVDERTENLRLEKEKTEAQAHKLMEMDRLKSEFFSNVSHEFRTPLTLIIGPLETMLSEGDAAAAVSNRHQTMLRNARRLLRLINQLLDISKLEAGKAALGARAVDLCAFVRPVAFAFQSVADQKQIALTVDANPESLEVFLDTEKMEKVLFNLLSNAFQFTAEGSITVRIRVVGEMAELSVIDTGVGIPEEQLPVIFDRFRQVDGSATRSQEGTGIGLSLVRELVELHRGTVDVASTIGEGTTFTMLLPLGRAHLRDEEVREGDFTAADYLSAERAAVETAMLGETISTCSDIGADPGVGETLLIVDDNPDMRAYIRDAFSPHYRVIEAADGQEGLARARQHRPGLIISDVMMPVMDGYAFCREVKADKHLNHIPLILLTAKATDNMKVEGLEIGADDYLSKPFNVRELQARVRNLLVLRGQERDMKNALEMAHRVQVSMLPSQVPAIEGLDLATFSEPARVVGGDYFDLLPLEDNRLGIVIGDVSGKGMPAALYMTMAKGLVQAGTGIIETPSARVKRFNRQFRRASTANMFISLCYAFVDPEARSVQFCNAGHNPLIHFEAETNRARLIRSHGMAIGLDRGEKFDRVVTDQELTCGPGDVLLFYTDGIPEIMNPHDDLYGESRMLQFLEANQGLSAKALLEKMRAELTEFAEGVDPGDDMTAVVLRFN